MDNFQQIVFIRRRIAGVGALPGRQKWHNRHILAHMEGNCGVTTLDKWRSECHIGIGIATTLAVGSLWQKIAKAFAFFKGFANYFEIEKIGEVPDGLEQKWQQKPGQWFSKVQLLGSIFCSY